MRLLFLLFIVLPIIELWLLFKVAGVIGFLPTLALVLIAGALGVRVLRRQGFNALLRPADRLRSNDVPGQDIVERFLVAAAGALLIVPGLITDAVALILLLPLTRRLLARRLLSSGISAWTQQSGSFTFMHMGGTGSPRDARSANDVFEGEFTRETSPATPIAGPEREDNSR